MNILKVNFSDLNLFAKHYTQKFKYGGIFTKTEHKYHVGDKVFLIINIESNKHLFAMDTEVVFTSPHNSLSFANYTGFAFVQNEQNKKYKNDIEVLLGGLVKGLSIF